MQEISQSKLEIPDSPSMSRRSPEQSPARSPRSLGSRSRSPISSHREKTSFEIELDARLSSSPNLSFNSTKNSRSSGDLSTPKTLQVPPSPNSQRKSPPPRPPRSPSSFSGNSPSSTTIHQSSGHSSLNFTSIRTESTEELDDFSSAGFGSSQEILKRHTINNPMLKMLRDMEASDSGMIDLSMLTSGNIEMELLCVTFIENHFPRLKILNLSGQELSKEQIIKICNQYQLTELKLDSYQIEAICELQVTMENILNGSIAGLKIGNTKITLDRLDLSGRHLESNKAEVWAEVLKKTNITKLDLHDNCIKSKGVLTLTKVLKHTTIEQLNLAFNPIGDEGARALAEILASTKISLLDLSGIGLGDEGARALTEIFGRSKTLKEMRITGKEMKVFCGLQNSFVSIIKYIEDGTLKSLKIGDTKIVLNPQIKNIGDLEVRRLADILRSDTLPYQYHLQLSCANMKYERVCALAKVLEYTTTIRHLDLRDNEINDEGVYALVEVLEHTEIRTLLLGYNPITDKGVQALATVLKRTKIWWLSLNSTNAGSEGICALAEVLEDTMIKRLGLSPINMGGKGAKALARVLSKTQIIDLDLFFNDLENEGFLALAKALPGSKVRDLQVSGWYAPILNALVRKSGFKELTLQDRSIGDEDAKALAHWLKDSHIERLNLSLNHIGDEGAIALAKVLESTSLKWLNLVGNNIGAAGVRALEAAGKQCPHIKIHHN